ncbi:hypothetical protein BGZ60DRAFT_410179 [Tricladium varicosporioides]|nr:hypothetical protein BGZ60DRAFT_410179 [Hymenoscyphus varicosporioides]
MATSIEPATSPNIESEYTRLHITPLNPNLLSTILPASILPNARNISYHTIQTFPEKGYGFLELPVMDAEKIKKKLNGSILKGTKVRIEKARPMKEAVIERDEPKLPKRPSKDSTKKRKRGDETIPAAEIGERQVKRGWTTPAATIKSSKTKDKEREKDEKRVKSKFTSGPECLFKTVLPPNVSSNTKAVDVKVDKKKRKAGKEVLVHEFKKIEKFATFLRDTSASKTAKGIKEFVEGKGWVDESGNVVEEVKRSQKVTKPTKAAPKTPIVIAKEADSSSEDSNDSPSSDEESESSDAKSSPVTIKAAAVAISEVKDKASVLSSDSSSEESDSESNSDSAEESDSSSEDESEDEASSDSSEEQVNSRPVSRPQSASGPPLNLSIKIPSPAITATPISAEVHPLEALYKKSKQEGEDTAVVPNPTFSFFGADADGDEEMEEAHDKVPLTPFTQRDFEYRGIRSAAPTPDTAHANKRFLWPKPKPDQDDDEDDGEASSSPIRKKFDVGMSKEIGKKEEAAAPESDFQKWFYENRGETNRAWKKRRKIVAKEKRHRENKKRQERAI